MRKAINTIFFVTLFLCITSLLVSCVACGNRDKKQNVSKKSETPQVRVKAEFPIQLNYNEDYPVKDIDLREIADIEYVAFRDEGVLLAGDVGYRGISISEEYIITSNWKEGTVFIFDRSGNLINKFNRKGRGSGEYQRIDCLFADYKNREIFAFDHVFTFEVLVYSFEGEFKRSFKIPSHLWIGAQAVDYNDEYIFANFRPASPLKRTKDNIYYYFISKSNGKFVPVSIDTRGYISSNANLGYEKIGHGALPFNVKTGACRIANNSKEVLLSDFGCDTMYISKENLQFTPFIIKSPPIIYDPDKESSFEDATSNGNIYRFNNIQEPTLVTVKLKTNKHTLVGKIIRRENDRQEKSFIIDNYTGEIFEANIISTDNDIVFTDDKEKLFLRDFHTHAPTQNTLISKCSTIEYIEHNEKGLLKGELKEFVSTLEDDDNDFLVIIRFKD